MIDSASEPQGDSRQAGFLRALTNRARQKPATSILSAQERNEQEIAAMMEPFLKAVEDKKGGVGLELTDEQRKRMARLLEKAIADGIAAGRQKGFDRW